jgi:hypothetical protein
VVGKYEPALITMMFIWVRGVFSELYSRLLEGLAVYMGFVKLAQRELVDAV